jgi:hypothetical protein
MRIDELTPPERRKLADKTDCNAVYLWQCGKGLRTPSPDLAKKLMEFDPRLTWEDIYIHVGSSQTPSGEVAA